MAWPTDDLVTDQMDSDADSPLLMRPQLLALVSKVKAMLGLTPAISGAVTGSGLTQTPGRMLGRSTASTGAVEEILVGSGLVLSGGVLYPNYSTLAESNVTASLGYNPKDNGAFGLGTDQILTRNTFGLGLAHDATYAAADLRAVSPYFDGNTVSGYALLTVTAGTWRYKGPTLSPLTGKYPVGQFQRVA